VTEASPAEGWLKLASMLGKAAMAERASPPLRVRLRGALLEGFALACFGVAVALALVAIGLGLAPFLGAAGAVGADAGLVAALGLAAFPWTGKRVQPPASPPGTDVRGVARSDFRDSRARERPVGRRGFARRDRRGGFAKLRVARVR